MCRRYLYGTALAIAIAILSVACGVAQSPTPSPPLATPTTASAPTLTPSPTASITSRPSPTAPSPTPAPEAAADILIQLQWGRTRPEAYVRFGRIPEFALQANGSVFYIDEGSAPPSDQPQLMVAHLTPAETQELFQQVLDLSRGLERYTDACWQDADGTAQCAEGAPYSILELNRLPDAWTLICNVGDFATDPQQLKALRALLQDYQRPNARPYTPHKAVLFLQAAEAPADVSLLDWPLDPAWLAPPGGTAEVEWARVAAGSDLRYLLGVLGRNMGDFYVRQGNQVYKVYLVPWLPGVDLSDLAAAYSRPIRPTAEPGATPVPTPIAPCRGAGQGASQLVIEAHPLKLGPMIAETEGVYFETADGDTAEVLARNGCYRTGGPLFPSLPASVRDQLLAYSDSGDMGDELRVTLGSQLVYDVLTRPCAFTEVKGGWGYDGHWVIELGLPSDQDPWFSTRGQIVQDGQDLNAACGYDESYNFALFGSRPFFFYHKQGETGILFDGQELPLPYDEIPHYLCCSAGAMNPVTYPNMVQFFGRRGNQWYYVEASVPFTEAQKSTLCPPTPTPAPTPVTATAPPVPTTVGEPVFIRSFEVTPAEVWPGKAVTLTWNAVAEQVWIIKLDEAARMTNDVFAVPVSGTLVLTTAPTQRNWAGFTLHACSADLRTCTSAGAQVKLTCPDVWFFPDPPADCAGMPHHTTFVAQTFERGLMVWMKASDEVQYFDTVIILYEGAGWLMLRDYWTPGMPEEDPDIVPPPGYDEPRRGFGKIWREMQEVRDGLGWAIGLEFVVGEGTFQCGTVKYNHCYFTGPEDEIYVLKPYGSGWFIWSGPASVP